VLSLTPVFVLSLLGVVPLCLTRRYGFRFLALATAGLTVVVFAFYLTRPIIDRNYGGMTCGPRWFFWLYPAWLIWMIPALERAGTRWWGVAIGLLLLIVSTASSLDAWENPWVQPWLYDWMSARGWNV
jgi:hypothetical protein